MAQALLNTYSEFELIPDPTRIYFESLPEAHFAPSFCNCRRECKAVYGINSICNDCEKPHRFDEDRDNANSTFTCTWCGHEVVNMEYDIRRHLDYCDHSPRPKIYTEDAMCDCILNCYCGYTPRFLATYTVKFYESSRESRWINGCQISREIPNITYRRRPEMHEWNRQRLGYPPNHQELIVDANERVGIRPTPISLPGR